MLNVNQNHFNTSPTHFNHINFSLNKIAIWRSSVFQNKTDGKKRKQYDYRPLFVGC
jgi:hypothetical protein